MNRESHRDPPARPGRPFKLYRFLWNTHKWTGVVLAIFLVNMAVTGFLLLQKKNFEWIQPGTRTGTTGEVDSFITIERLFDVVLSAGRAEFQSSGDIDRVDFRPGKRVFKVRSRHDHGEIQVDATTGEILHIDWRPSDLLENLHDGSFFSDSVHAWLMPVVAVGLLFLSGSGLYLWLSPILRKRRQRRLRETRVAKRA